MEPSASNPSLNTLSYDADVVVVPLELAVHDAQMHRAPIAVHPRANVHALRRRTSHGGQQNQQAPAHLVNVHAEIRESPCENPLQ